MARGIVKLANDEYIEWSTICDAPLGSIVDRSTAVARWGGDRVERCDRRNHSWTDMGPMEPAQVIDPNRAGPNETQLTLDEIRAQYRGSTDA